MKKYMEPEMEIVEISRNDVIVTSPDYTHATNYSGVGPGLPCTGKSSGDVGAECCN